MTSAEAQKILDAVNREAMLDLAQELVKIPSFKTEETEVARFIATYLESRGYQVQLQEVEPGRFQTIATLRGTGGGKSLMLNGHIDIDPLAMGWRRDHWTPQIEGDRLYGAGIRNMKAGVASMIAAAEAVRRSGVALKGDLVLACVVGELQGGVGTKYLCHHGPLADMAVVPEPFGAEIRAKSTELSYTAPDLLPTKFTAQEIRHQSAPECRDSVLQRVTRVPARLSRDVVNGPGPKSFYFTQQGSVYLSCTPIPWKQPFQRFCRLMESISYAFSTPRVGSTPTPGTIVFSKIRPALTPPFLILVGRTSLFPI